MCFSNVINKGRFSGMQLEQSVPQFQLHKSDAKTIKAPPIRDQNEIICVRNAAQY